MKNIYFDTNAYRYMVHKKNLFEIKKAIQEIKTLQQNKSINAFVHVYVVAELLSHLADPSDPHFDECKNSILFMWEHCLIQNTKFSYITDFDSFFTEFYFNTQPKGSFETYDQFTQICSYIFNNQDDHNLFDIRLQLKGISDAVKTLEEQFIETNKNFIINTDPNAEDWQLYKKDKKFRVRNLRSLSSKETIDLIAELEVGKIANYANIKLSSDEKTKYSKVLKENFILHIIMRINILKKIIISGIDFTIKKNANLFWDMEIASCVQTGSFKNPDRFSLVTNDKAILEAANECNCRDKVLTLSEYKKYLSS